MSAPEIAPELAQKMAEAWRTLSRVDPSDVGQFFAKNTVETAKAIVAELPTPIDPDLIEARLVVIATLAPESHARCRCREKIAAGEHDYGHRIRAALAAIKRGRELEREGK